MSSRAAPWTRGRGLGGEDEEEEVKEEEGEDYSEEEEEEEEENQGKGKGRAPCNHIKIYLKGPLRPTVLMLTVGTGAVGKSIACCWPRCPDFA